MEIEEKVTKSEGDGDHPSSHYLVVEDSTKPTTWHLRVRGMDGKPDHGLMGAAWAALHSGYRGNKYEGPNKEEALKKLMGMYHSEGMPMPGMGGKATFFKTGNDTWFLGIYSNNYEDKQGEIITEKAHFDFVSWANEKGVKPPIVLLHQPQFPSVVHLVSYLALETGRMTVEEYNQNYMDLYKATTIAQTKAIGIKNGFVIVVGKVLPDKVDLVNKIDTKSWGMSHGFIPLPKSDNIINGYRSFEFSLAPLSLTANGVTAIGFKEDVMGEVLEILPEEITVHLSPEEIAEATKKAQEVLGNTLAKKTLETPTEEKTEQVEVQQPEYATLRANLAADFKLTDLEVALKTVTDKLVSQDALIEAQSKTIAELVKVVGELKKSDDQKIAEAFNKPLWPSFEKKAEPTAEEKAKIEEIKAEIPQQIVEKKTNGNMLEWALKDVYGQ